jgi:hypothetical protein
MPTNRYDIPVRAVGVYDDECNEFHKIANESHDTKTNGDCLAYLREF